MLINIVVFVLAVYLAIMLGMFLLQRSLMYYPEKHIEDPAHYGLDAALVIRLPTSDGIAIDVWHHAAEKAHFPTIVYFHGNAGHVGDRAEKLRHFADAGFGILALSYRGFGKSDGLPTELGLYEDARTAVAYAKEKLEIAAEELMIYGESLGSGVATHTAYMLAQGGTPIGALILEAPYTSVARRAQEMYPFIPAFWLARDKYHSIDKIDKIKAPLLLFHGEKDTVIPVHHGRTMLEKALDPKQGVFFDEVDHTAFDYPTLAEHLVNFATLHGLIKPGK